MASTVSIKKHVDDQLRNYSGTGPLVVPLDGDEAILEVQSVDALACSLMRIGVRRTVALGDSVESVRRSAEELARRLTYLLEPIRVHELDALQSAAQLRSNPPQRDEATIRYYELNASGVEIELVRYQKQPGNSRVRIPMALTREVLIRLLGDLTT